MKTLCRALKISHRVLEEVKSAIYQFYDMASLDSPVKSQDDDLLTLSDAIPDTCNIENETVDRIMKDSIHTELWEIVSRVTDKREYSVIVDRFVQNKSMQAIGSEIGVTVEMVRQIQNKGLRKLRRSCVAREIAKKFEVSYASAYYAGGVRTFNRTWTSSTEKAAIRIYEGSVSVR